MQNKRQISHFCFLRHGVIALLLHVIHTKALLCEYFHGFFCGKYFIIWFGSQSIHPIIAHVHRQVARLSLLACILQPHDIRWPTFGKLTKSVHFFRFINLNLLLLCACGLGKGVSSESINNVSNPSIPFHEHPNLFILQVAKAIKRNKGKNLVLFTGHTVKRIFDPKDISKGVSLTAKTKGIKIWNDVNKLLGEFMTASNHTLPAIHIHNEFMLGDFLELVNNQYKRSYGNARIPMRQPADILSAIEFATIMNSTVHPFVMTNSADENWGFLSTPIGKRTAKWINMTNHLRLHRSNFDTVQYFLNSEKVISVIRAVCLLWYQ